MSRVRELEAILSGMGFDPSASLDDYVEIHNRLYPKNVRATLRWDGPYEEYKGDPEYYYLNTYTEDMCRILDAWGIKYNKKNEDTIASDLYFYLVEGGTHWEDTRDGIQGVISKSWRTLAQLLDAGPDVMQYATSLILELPFGSVKIKNPGGEPEEESDGEGVDAEFDVDEMTLTSLNKIGMAAWAYIEECIDEGVDIEEIEDAIEGMSMTAKVKKLWDELIDE